MILPDILEPFRAEAQKLVAEEIMFSGPTYQVRFGDETAPIWVFLQLDHNDGVKDLFCGCDSCSETGACIHMASAIFAIFKGYAYPLHKRFEASPFYALCSALPSTSAPSCRQQGATLRWGSGAGSVLLKGPSEWMNMVKVLATRQELETEETSIKFSNLSEEEVQAWRQGIVSDSLRFELSTHSDLAKHLFMLSEKRPCHFRFEGDRALPSRLSCDFEEISCSFPLLGSLELVLDKLPPQRTTPRIEPYGGQTIKELLKNYKIKQIMESNQNLYMNDVREFVKTLSR